tara:strand:+ start:1274 stop:1471 length:198 start_codon:yes stop_codon:yes gene_type:complete
MEDDRIIYSIIFSVFNISELLILNKRINPKIIIKNKYLKSKKDLNNSFSNLFLLIEINEKEITNK